MTAPWKPSSRRQCLAVLAGASLVRAQDAVWPGSRPGDVAPDWVVLHGYSEFSRAEGMLPAYVQKQHAAFDAARERAVSAVKTLADVEAYRGVTRPLLDAALGEWPARTALNVAAAGKLERPDYIIEKVIFESRPAFYVTANVYVPRRPGGPYPAMLASVGHWGAGKAYVDYQQAAAYLASRGMVVLVYDLAGMGERVESWNTVTRRPLVHPGTSEYFVTTEHGIAAGRTILAKGSLLPFLLWDSVRALDYLAGRPDVDPKRIAASGVSGGGWFTEVLAAIDDRVRVAIPVCYGGCIADQFCRARLSVVDVEALIAPRPLLLMEATGDARPGVFEKQRRAGIIKAFYAAAGVAERTRFMIGEGPHSYTPDMYPVMYDWLARWLPMERSERPAAFRPIALESEADLAATATGQVATSLGGETIFSLARAEGRRAAAGRTLPRDRAGWSAWRARLREKLAERLAVNRGAVTATVLGRSEHDGYSLERLVYRPEDGIYIPSVLLLPAGRRPAPAVLAVNEGGKNADGLAEQFLVPLAKAGYAVLAIDPRGMGETAMPARRTEYAELAVGAEAGEVFTALRSDRTLIGMRVADVLGGVSYLAGRSELDGANVSAAGWGAGGLLTLFAAALDERIRRTALNGTLLSYAAVLASELYSHPLSEFVPAAAGDFDLPEAAGLVAPRPLLLVNPVDALHRRVERERAAAEYARTGDLYRLAGSAGGFRMAQANTPAEAFRLLIELLRS